MARRTESVTIDGFSYDLTQLGAVEGRKLLIRFGQLMGRLAPVMLSAAKLDGDALAGVAETLDGLEPEKLEPLWEAFTRSAVVRTNAARQPLADVFDDHFAGNYYGMVRFFIESAKLNFGDFLERMLTSVTDENAKA
jgi:hypothetical protein